MKAKLSLYYGLREVGVNWIGTSIIYHRFWQINYTTYFQSDVKQKRHTFLCISILTGIKYVNGYLVFTSSKARLLALKLTSSLFFVKTPAPTLKVNISKCMSISSTYLHLHLKHLLIWSLYVRHIVSSQAEYLQGLTRSLYINEKKDCILYVFFK